MAEGAPVIPISAQLKYNIEVVCEYITKNIPIPIRDFTSKPRLIGEWGRGEATEGRGREGGTREGRREGGSVWVSEYLYRSSE